MSDSHEHSVGLPNIHDEAGDTPMWVPVFGLALLVVATLYLVISAALEDIDPDTEQALPAAAAAPALAAPTMAAPTMAAPTMAAPTMAAPMIAAPTME